ncbi:MAG TPA: ThuA domain-containing protein [Polyangia bacterium]|nr:ThuA domain-containing protein [Polyangia bacterium]
MIAGAVSHRPARLFLAAAVAIGCGGGAAKTPGARDGGSDSGGSGGAGPTETSGNGGATVVDAAGAGGGAGGAGGSGGIVNGGGGVTTDADAGDARVDGGVGVDGGGNGPIKVLLFNHTAGYGHQSRLTSIPFLVTAAAANNIDLDLQYAHQTPPGKAPLPEGTNDSATPPNLSAFVPGGLDRYDVVLFLNTTGNVFQGADEKLHQQALQDYVDNHHGGFVGAHSATDTYDDSWPWYQDLIGSIYSGHSNVVAGTVRKNPGVSSVILTEAMVPEPWRRNEEWYTFRRDVRTLAGFTALLLANAPDPMGGVTERPNAWVHSVPGGGRVFYTGFGHFVDAFKEDAVMRLLMAGIKWAARRSD